MVHKSPRWTLTRESCGFGSPLWKRGSGGFLDRRHRCRDRFDDSIQLLQHLKVGKPEDPQTLLFQVSGAPLIVCRLLRFQMLGAVYFHHQGRRRGVEIDNVGADRLLPIELHPKHLLAAQPPPQALLRVSHCRAQPARPMLQARVVLEHAHKIPPGPPLSKGETLVRHHSVSSRGDIGNDQPRGRGGRAGLLLACVLLSACAATRNLPRWAQQPPRDDAYLYAVGTRTGAVSIEEARRGAVEQAVGELVRRFGVTSQTSYEEVRTQLETRVRDEIQSASSKIQIKDAVVQDWYLRRTSSGYDAFVLLRYPREQAEREQGRLRAQEDAALHAANQALRRGEAARRRGDAGAAISAYVEASRLPGDSATAAALRTQVSDRLSSLAADLQIEAISGGEQTVWPFAPLPEPLTVRASLDGRAAAGLPVRFQVINGTADLAPDRVSTDQNGAAAVTVARVHSVQGHLIVRAAPDAAQLLPPSMVGTNGAIEAALRAIGERGVDFRLRANRTLRPLRVVVLIDERDGESATRHSVLSSLLTDRLHDAGFRVMAVHELGRTNIELLEHAFDRGQLIALSPALSGLTDIAIGGWCETRPGSENHRRATSVLVDANVKAIELTHGEVIAAHTVIGRPGFGEREDRARVEALKAASEELAEALVTQMAMHMDTASDLPAPNSDHE